MPRRRCPPARGPHFRCRIRGCKAWIEREQFLGFSNAFQRKSPDRNELVSFRPQQEVGELRGAEHVSPCGLAHVADAAYFIDCLANHSEIEPVGCADVAVEYIARMQTEMDVSDRQALCFAAACKLAEPQP